MATRNSMAFSKFCEYLGTPLKNVRNSWCAYSPELNRAVFTVWADNLVNGQYLYWRKNGAPHQNLIGARELRSVIDAVQQNGVDAFAILCYARDPGAIPRVRARFVEESLLVLQFKNVPEGIVGVVIGEISAEAVRAGRTAEIAPVQSALDDLGAPPVGSVNPQRVIAETHGYRRDDAVRMHVIKRAKGVCEYCGTRSFLTSDNRHYLEAHHIIRLASQGPDTIDNVIALCPTHHREAHYGARAPDLEAEFESIVAKANKRA